MSLCSAVLAYRFGALTMKGKTIPCLVDATKVVDVDQATMSQVEKEVQFYMDRANKRISHFETSEFSFVLEDEKVAVKGAFVMSDLSELAACYRDDFRKRLEATAE